MNTEVRMFKLTNGEDIIATVDETNSELYCLDNPLLMRIHSKLTPAGMQEGLHLSRWMQPFSEATTFSIDKKHVVISTEVSIGLNKYYEYSVKSFERDGNHGMHPGLPEPTEERLAQIEVEETINEDDDEEEFLSFEPISKLIH